MRTIQLGREQVQAKTITNPFFNSERAPNYGLIVLAVLAVAGNYFSITLFNPVSFIFGSIFALIALRHYGLAAGTLVALVGSSVTIFTWGHGYAVFVFALEVIAVYFLNRKLKNLAFADTAFWLLLGVPLTLLFYAVAMDMGMRPASFIAAKSVTNAILNAVIADLVYTTVIHRKTHHTNNTHKVPLISILFNVIFLIAVTPAVIATFVDSRHTTSSAIESVSQNLTAVGTWVALQMETSTNMDEIVRRLDREFLPALATLNEKFWIGNNLGIGVGFADGTVTAIKGDVLSGGAHGMTAGMVQGGGSDQQPGLQRGLVAGTSTSLDGGITFWAPNGDAPELIRSRLGRYMLKIPLSPETGARFLIIECASAPQIEYMETRGNWDQFLLFATILAALAVSWALSIWLARPMRNLAATSGNMMDTILERSTATLSFPTNGIREYDQMMQSLQDMHGTLLRAFASLQEGRQTLEARVLERTKELAQMSEIARQTTNAILMTDTKGRTTWANEAFTELSGYTLEDMLGKKPGSVLQRAKPPYEIHENMVGSMERLVPFHVDLLNHAKDGRPYWIEIRCSPMWDEDGTHIGYIAIENDITERREQTQFVQTALERLSLATEIAALGVWVYNPNDGKIDSNDQNYVLYGLDPEAGLNAENTLFRMVNPDQRDDIIAKFQDALLPGRPAFNAEYTVCRADGEERVFRTCSRITRDEDGQPLFVTGVNMDVTEERRYQEELRRAGQYSQAVLNNVIDSIITIDQNGRILSFNSASERMFGYNADEILGRNISVLMPPEMASQHDGFMADYFGGKTASVVGKIRKMEGLRSNGERFDIELAVTELVGKDKTSFVGVVRDITDRIRTERMKSEFLGTVSHELRTPLTSISGTLSVIQAGVFGELSEDGKRLVSSAVANGERLTTLINEILDMERLNAGRMTLKPALHPAAQMIEASVMENEAFANKFNVALQIAPSLPNTQIFVDDTRFKQILTNFISNAIKFSTDGQTVMVNATERDCKIRISVVDEGKGIPKHMHGRLFQKFSQVDSSDSRHSGGSGLGLAITKELAELMDGTVGFVSGKSKGSTFWVEFPIKTGNRTQLEPMVA